MKLFEPFKPMEPKNIKGEKVYDNPEYIYQIKWDGIRGILHTDGNKVKVFNKKMRDKTLQYPELQLLNGLKKEVILDGEITVLKEGIPSFSAVIRRDFAVDESKIKGFQKKLPILYCVFDIIYYQGNDLLNLTWLERNKYLNKLRENLDLSFVHFTETFENGRNLFKVIKEKNMEGIVAKEKSGIYEIGAKTGKWCKIKYRRRQHCVVCGYTIKNLRPSALLLGVYDDLGQLIYVGRAGSGLTGLELDKLVKATKKIIIPRPPVLKSPREKLNYIWLEPRITVLVEYAEWTDDLSLRSPVIKGFTTVSPLECRLN